MHWVIYTQVRATRLREQTGRNTHKKGWFQVSTKTLPMRPRRLRRLLALSLFGAILAGTGVGWATDARADGVISDTEAAYINMYGAGAVCTTISEYPSEPGVYGVLAAIMEDGFTPDSAADIVNASVATYCPRHWSLLQAVGAKARGETGGYVA